ncbi:unnamed protein product [Phaedon cochleariae]|uniref:MOSC domain-containing protein n=1 Tax=Phaedon cochleariae TaxID=80249 RepID=A0A9P0DIS0_PHACE|nr:unnamed protein product [Phaedon cochleariae]
MEMVKNSIDNRVIIFVGVVSLGTILYAWLSEKTSKKVKIPTEWKAVGKIAKMCIYPMKSGRRIELQQAECSKQGLMEAEKFNKSLRLRDRSFLAFHHTHFEYRNARHHPKMVLIEVESRDIDCVAFKAPGVPDLVLKIPTRSRNNERIIKHWRDEEVSTIDCGDNAAKWISNYVLGNDAGLRLGYHDGTFERTQINHLYKDKIDYYKRGLRNESTGLNADLTAVLILTRPSLSEVNRRIGSEPVSEDSFRPNLVLDGVSMAPFAEDQWEWLRVGNIVMRNVAECMRCSMTTVDMETGVRRGDGEPLRSMRNYRMSAGPEKAPVMGILVEIYRTGLISVDDTVYIGKS